MARHGFAHVCYEEGEPAAGPCQFPGVWLATYPRDGFSTAT